MPEHHLTHARLLLILIKHSKDDGAQCTRRTHLCACIADFVRKKGEWHWLCHVEHPSTALVQGHARWAKGTQLANTMGRPSADAKRASTQASPSNTPSSAATCVLAERRCRECRRALAASVSTKLLGCELYFACSASWPSALHALMNGGTKPSRQHMRYLLIQDGKHDALGAGACGAMSLSPTTARCHLLTMQRPRAPSPWRQGSAPRTPPAPYKRGTLCRGPRPVSRAACCRARPRRPHMAGASCVIPAAQPDIAAASAC